MKVRRGAEPFVLEKHSNYVYIGSLQRDRLALRPWLAQRRRSPVQSAASGPSASSEPRPATAQEAPPSVGRGSKDRPITVEIYAITIIGEFLYSLSS